MNGVTIGQYYPEDSIIHSLDPRMKIITTFIYIISVFFIKNLLVYLIPFVLLFLTIKLAKVPFKIVLRSLRSILFVIIFTIIINIFMSPGKQIIFQFGIFTATYEGLYTAAVIGIRLILLVMASSVLTLTTSPIHLTDAIEYLLRPYKKFGLPAHEIAMMMTIALRFIPTLMEEASKIMKAQMARGADFDSGGIMKKAKGMIPLLVPLFISAFRRADELALAMEARCYNGDLNRTKMKQLVLNTRDIKASVFVVAYILLIIVSGIYL